MAISPVLESQQALGGGSASAVNRPLFIHKVISSHLREMGYPEKSINSLQRCGEECGFYVTRSCLCGDFSVGLTWRCSSRVCPECSKVRRRRIFASFLPFFKQFPVTRKDFHQFLTISPKNYKSLPEGLKSIRKGFSKFIRRKYIKERIKAGFYIIEAVQVWKGKPIFDKNGHFLYNAQEDGWNLHIHAVVYGAWLDYRMRGKCFDCSQNLLKFDKLAKRFYCGNKKCNSLRVEKHDNSTTLGREWSASNNGQFAHIYGEKVNYIHGAVHYLTKYISSNKEDFKDDKGVAEYIVNTHSKRLINSFGLFYSNRKSIKKPKYWCDKCDSELTFEFDIEVSYAISEVKHERLMKPPGYFAGERSDSGVLGRVPAITRQK